MPDLEAGTGGARRTATIREQLLQGRMMIHQMMLLMHLEMQLRQQALTSYQEAQDPTMRLQRLDDVMALNEQLNEVGGILSTLLSTPLVTTQQHGAAGTRASRFASSTFADLNLASASVTRRIDLRNSASENQAASSVGNAQTAASPDFQTEYRGDRNLVASDGITTGGSLHIPFTTTTTMMTMMIIITMWMMMTTTTMMMMMMMMHRITCWLLGTESVWMIPTRMKTLQITPHFGHDPSPQYTITSRCQLRVPEIPGLMIPRHR